jgi:branched-chain amino acid transport system permease protein
MLYREVGQFKTSYDADQAIFPIAQDRWFVLLVVAFALIGMPLVAGDYLCSEVLIPVLILSIAAIGLNILTGYCGQVSLGTGGFMAVGAYAAYNVALRLPDLNLIVAFLFAGVMAMLVGVLFGLPSLRIKGFYLAVATLAAEIIGIRPLHAKLSAFAVSSFYIGIAGALWGFFRLGSWEPLAFDINRSFQVLFMVIIGGLGSILGSFLGAAFIVLVPILLSQLPRWLDIPVSTATISHVESMVFGAMIVLFLIAEPNGLARLWATAKEKLRSWPFPY